MSSLWHPAEPMQTSRCMNAFDMLLGFQTELDTQADSVAKVRQAEFAVSATRRCLEMYSQSEQQISLVTELAVMKIQQEKGLVGVMGTVGLRGFLETVHCITIKNILDYSLALKLDVIELFPVDEPDKPEAVMDTVTVPIASVRYIEIPDPTEDSVTS